MYCLYLHMNLTTVVAQTVFCRVIFNCQHGDQGKRLGSFKITNIPGFQRPLLDG